MSNTSTLPGKHEGFLKEVLRRIELNSMGNKTALEKLGMQFDIPDKNTVKELTELAITITARNMAHQDDLTVPERYRQIVRLYETQVNLSHRTSQSILLQQYSTPAPIAYLAGIFTAPPNLPKGEGLVFEPSAGNGLLTIAFNPKNVIINEIDSTRFRHLSFQKFKAAYQVDATKDFSQSIDKTFYHHFGAVITNPPFGTADVRITFDNYPIHKLEHLMALRALETMKDDGKAAIIIGNHTKYDEKGRVQKGANRIFLNYLYSHYQVMDIIPINGSKLYSRQGTGFNTRLILISGRKPKPEGAAPVYDIYRDTIVSRFDTLFDRIQEAIKESRHQAFKEDTTMNQPAHTNDSQRLQAYEHYVHFKKKYPDAVILVGEGGNMYCFNEDAHQVERATGYKVKAFNVKGKKESYIEFPGEASDQVLHKLYHRGNKVAIIDILPDSKKTARQDQKETAEDLQAALELELLKLKGDLDLGAPYLPASESCVVLNTVVPDSMDFETKQALAFIKQEVGGNMDAFVRQRLGYFSSMDLCKALSAEQTDAVAMAIYNIEAREQGMIIGDQTGIGKGRVAAAMIRYAVQQGHKPIFITEKPNLFSDIYRDLAAIGSPHLVPFIVNGRESKTDIKDENGEVIYQALAPSEQSSIFKTGKIPAGYDFVLGTYSQFNSPDKKPEKPQYLRTIAEGNIMILDESHNASGSSQTGEFLQRVVGHAKGVVFLSATFAKRPDNMPIYAMKTAISDANMSKDELIAAITKGGVALQEVLASALVKEGQMLRRERSFEGVEVNYITLDRLETEHKAIADNVTNILRGIIAFQSTTIDKMVADLDDIAVKQGKEVNIREGTSQAGVDNLPYFSKVFQVIHQMLFAIKAEAVADRAILRLKEGLKPVIAFSSTMGSFIEQMENDKGLPVSDGDIIHADFSEVLLKGLNGVLRYTETSPEGEKIYKAFDLADMSMEGRSQYLELAEKIKTLTSGISISPIDIIIQKIKAAGYSVAEVTGRQYEVQINTRTGKGMVRTRQRINTNDAFRQFNNNEVDVLMINQSGSTGASAHAIITPKVPAAQVKQRVMIVLQAELDINTEVQKRGRINRTGQILPPIYDYMMSAIPAEKRLMMMLQKKLKSLDANTTSNQKQSTKILDVPDFLNKYGDKIVTQYLVENKDINLLLGDPLGLANVGNEEAKVLEDAAHKVSGRVAVLNTSMQADFYNEVSQAYNEYVDYLKQIDEYDLEVEAMNLEAETLSQQVVRMGKGAGSEFGTDSILEKVTANVLKRPFTRTELENIIKEGLSDSDPQTIQQDILKSYKAFSEGQLEKELADSKAAFEEDIKHIGSEKKGLKIRETEGEKAWSDYCKDREKALKEAQGLQAQKIKTQNINRSQYMSSLFKFFFIGRNILYPMKTFSEGDIKVPAAFIGFTIDTRKKNPYAPSQVRLRFAISSSSKYIAMPASYTKDINAIMGASHDVATAGLEDTLSRWEQAIKTSNVARQTRYIVTGNLLQAFASYQGKLISYTTIDGNVRKGILLPEYTEVDMNAHTKVSVPVGKALKVFQSIAKGHDLTTDAGVSIFNTGDAYKMIVPSSFKRGGEVFLDTEILKLMDKQNFDKVGDKMTATFPHQNIDALIQLLQARINDSVSLSVRQYQLIQNQPSQTRSRHPIKLLSKEELEEQENLQLQTLAIEAELEMELELLRLRQAA